jgi:7,8-dihydropterin-6-yl-methyl-4-(beta-D-ribofuranosyl)aminobenzene 5'-phosphate synthase
MSNTKSIQKIRSVLAAFLAAVLMTMLIPTLVAAKAGNTPRQVQSLKITVLVTNLAGDPHQGSGEWGYSALVEVDGHEILYDTGASADLVLQNARALHIDLSGVEDVVLSHNHWDHVGGLMALRNELSKVNPRAMSRVHVGAGIFQPRLDDQGENHNGLAEIQARYRETGGTFIIHEAPTELWPGVWFTGPVPRPNPEKNCSPGLHLTSAQGKIEDNVPEDSAMVFSTSTGAVILTGCAHAGIVNISTYAVQLAGSQPILAVIGGLHLFDASDETVTWTATRLKGFGLRSLLAGHCTGIEATYRIRTVAGLQRSTAVVSAVGSSFTLGNGMDPLRLAR